MFRTIVVHTRPNTSVDFFNPKTSPLVTDETRAYIRNNFVVTGKIVHSEEVASADGLSLTITAIFQDEAAYNEWRNDTTITENLYNVGNQYRDANSITSVIQSEETI